MKKIFLSLLLCLVSLFSYGQLQGKFDYGQDGHIYFILTNPTGYQIPVIWGVANIQTNEVRNTQGVMAPYSTFTYGPTQNWVWLKGEIFMITYQNGQQQYWTCPQNDTSVKKRGSPSFKGKGKCRHGGCKCQRYVSAGNGGQCVCGHWDYVHD